jgi:hypothetical protein
MSNTFVVNWIQTRSDVPLYFNPPSGPVALPTGWKVVWQAPNIVTPYSAAAFKLTAPTAIIGLAVDCSFGSSFVGKNLLVQGYLNGVIATSSPVTVPNTGRVVVQSFVRSNPRGSPIAYRGSFQWRLVQGSAVVATFDTLTPLEFYSIVPPPAGLWPSYGVSVDLLREYVPVWSDTTNKWMLASFYRFITQKIFGGPFVYDNIRGANRYALNHLGSSYKLEQYFRELRSGLAIPINCYDMAGIVQIVLSLFPDYNLVRWNFMQPYGWIYTTRRVAQG